MLARNGVVFLDDHLFGHGARVFLGYVEMACARGRVQTDLDRGWLRHVMSPAAPAPAECDNPEARVLMVTRRESTSIRPVERRGPGLFQKVRPVFFERKRVAPGTPA